MYSLVSSEQMFMIPLIKISIGDWANKKRKIFSWLEDVDYSNEHGPYFSDFNQEQRRNPNYQPNEYSHKVWKLLYEEVKLFDAQVNYGLEDVTPSMWTQIYYKGQEHEVHNHGALGWSCIVFLKFNPIIHKATKFYAPFNNFNSGAMLEYQPEVLEGDMIWFPSMLPHTSQLQESEEERVILSFNLK
tara:strand:+ start:158 stop:718 length:561 start_codon:yes stop_codon:yes gene_type:complete